MKSNFDSSAIYPRAPRTNCKTFCFEPVKPRKTFIQRFKFSVYLRYNSLFCTKKFNFGTFRMDFSIS